MLAGALFAGIGTTAARAEPAPMPQTDFTATWQIEGEQLESMGPSRIAYSASLGKMRIDMSGSGQNMTIVRNMETGQALMWSDMMPGMAMQVDTGRNFTLEGERTGQRDAVNGEACEIWTSNGAQVCITADGIPVRSVGQGVTATMTQIDRSPQDAGDFAPPEGLQVMNLPKGAAGMGGGMGAGMGMPQGQFPF